MGVKISKPAINIREALTEASAVVPYEQRQFHFDNLVTNGTFDADVSGWTNWGTNSGTDSSFAHNSAGYLEITRGAGSTNGTASQTFPTVSGQTYEITISTVTAQRVYWIVGSNTGYADLVNQLTHTGNTTVSRTFTAASASSWVGIWTDNNATAGVDNVSVYPSDGTDVAFTMPKGWKPLHVYDDGVLQREGSAEDYEVTFDGFNYYVKPTVANPGARNTVIGVRA